MYHLITGDCRVELPKLTTQFQAAICDPPYNLVSVSRRFGSSTASPTQHRIYKRHAGGFMGQKWDDDVAYDPAMWRLVYDRLLPGAHLIVLGGSRTHHRVWCAIEDAGFELRETLAWVYGSGFPKSHDVAKAIEGSKRGNARFDNRDFEDQGTIPLPGEQMIEMSTGTWSGKQGTVTDPEAQQWQGWGSGLKPAMEMICLARKPLDGTIAGNVLKHGVGGLNIDATRVPAVDQESLERNWDRVTTTDIRGGHYLHGYPSAITCTSDASPLGRWPSNFMHDGSDEVLQHFPQTKSGHLRPHINANRSGMPGNNSKFKWFNRDGDSGSAARFFYCAKASKKEKGPDCTHPTVKPLALMRYLARMICPPGGTILDPFMGSGTMGVAALQEGFGYLGIELSEEYRAIAEQRLAKEWVDWLSWTR